MARKALLVWCAASAVACGTAALATNSLWRAPSGSAMTGGNLSLPEIAAPAPLEGLDFPALADNFLPLATISFFSESGTSPFRGTIEATPVTIEPVPQQAGFAEVDGNADHRLTVLPPPRPNFQLARLQDPKAGLGEVRPGEQPAPGFEAPAPQTTPGFNWTEAFRPPTNKPERVIHAGVASWYGPGFHGRKTASGERFDQNDMTAAHRTLPFGTRVKVVDEKTGRSIIVRINDRGPFSHGRVIDLSKQAAQELGMGGLARVKVVAAN